MIQAQVNKTMPEFNYYNPGKHALLICWQDDFTVILLWGIFDHTEAVYQGEIDHCRSSSSQQPHECHLEVTQACNVTSDTFSITKTLPQTHHDLCRTAFPIVAFTVFSPWNVH